MKLLLAIFSALLVAPFTLALLRTWQVSRSPNQHLFRQGHAGALPDGFYRGSAGFPTANWVGKKFDYQTQRGINVFHKVGGAKEGFPFDFTIGPGLQDPDLTVIKLDYDVEDNPPWVRLILDEMVEIEQNTYLGKVHYRLLPNLPFTLATFRLKK